MASFLSRFQIPGLNSPKENRCQSLLLRGPSVVQSVLKQNTRFFWFGKAKEPVEYGSGNCGQPPVPRMELCKGCPSKCLCPKNGSKKPKKKWCGLRKATKASDEKESNSKKKDKYKEKLTLWEELFGPDPKRSWPDPCTCRLAHREKKKLRALDPRLTDPRYKETEGDVFLYTEPLKQCKNSCMEPQPKPPPAFKLPKAVLYKFLVDSTRKIPANEVTCETRKSCKTSRLIGSPYRMPYDELRPPARRRKVFTCQRGIRSMDIPKPVNRDLSIYGILPTSQQPDTKKDFKIVEDEEEITVADKNNFEPVVGKRSRIEQLKMLVQQKSSFKCTS